jgi:hypothetical protein
MPGQPNALGLPVIWDRSDSVCTWRESRAFSVLVRKPSGCARLFCRWHGAGRYLFTCVSRANTNRCSIRYLKSSGSALRCT